MRPLAELFLAAALVLFALVVDARVAEEVEGCGLAFIAWGRSG